MRRPGGVLERILARTREGLVVRRAERPLAAVRALAPPGPPRPFAEALTRRGRVNVIAEFKRRSPSRGVLRDDLHPVEVAQAYEVAGAAALSVLTEEQFFGGSLADLEEARAATLLPTLRKDFVVDPYQVWEARASGADAVLLIVAALPDRDLRELLAAADEAHLSALVEVHDAGELRRALAAGARLVGVNNRNLETLEVDVATCLRLAGEIPDDTVAVAESGLKDGHDVRRVLDAGFDAVLVGEGLMTAADPGAALERMIAEAAAPAPKAAPGTSRPRRVAVKACGLRRAEDVAAAVDAGVDAIGFVFWRGSPRAVDVPTAARLARALPPFVARVGVFVDETPSEMARIADAVGLDVLQLHGSETPDVLLSLPRRVVKALRVGEGFGAAAVRPWREAAGVLLDTGVAGRPGGTGLAFDWALARAVREEVGHLVLAGGLTPENVGAAISAAAPDAVDVSSGVESAPGVKDRARLRAFVAAVKKATGR